MTTYDNGLICCSATVRVDSCEPGMMGTEVLATCESCGRGYRLAIDEREAMLVP